MPIIDFEIPRNRHGMRQSRSARVGVFYLESDSGDESEVSREPEPDPGAGRQIAGDAWDRDAAVLGPVRPQAHLHA